MSKLGDLLSERRRRQAGKDDVIFIRWPELDKHALWVAADIALGKECRHGPTCYQQLRDGVIERERLSFERLGRPNQRVGPLSFQHIDKRSRQSKAAP
jgi:hypothetical protein